MSQQANDDTPSPLPSPVSEKEQAVSVKEVIQEKAPDVLKGIPQEKIEALARITIERHEFSMRSSPLPDPAELAAYNQIIPAGADRILKMAEAQSSHRIDIEKRVVRSQQTQGFCGQLFGLIIGVFGIGSATFAAIRGQPWFGSIIGGATLVSLVSAFLYSRHAQKKDLDKKSEQMIPPGMPVMPQSRNQKKKNRDK
jgi:uncharacterized membrane protein